MEKEPKPQNHKTKERNKPAKHESTDNGISNEMSMKQIDSNAFVWHENITEIDLSGRNIVALDEKVILPRNLLHLNLSHNKLVEVPHIILFLEKLVTLNLSHNAIECFDDCPEFCHTLELLDMSYNSLAGPPYWIWAERSQHLTQLNLSNNMNITKSFVNGYFEELLLYNTLVTQVDIHNCRLSKFTDFLSTFSNVKSLCLGSETCTTNANSLIEIPCHGLDKCSELISLKVCNTNVYNISPSIEMYKNIVEINLALNNLTGLPNEFCNLENLETCVLSCNKILYLFDDIYKLQKLCRLYLDNNEICMLPETFSKLTNLKILDLYNNHLEEMPNLENLEELDMALNYLEEPDDSDYLEKREKLRLLHENRYSGRKPMIIKSDNEYSEDSTSVEDDEELFDIFYNGKKIESPTGNPPSSPEDWDSDSYWEPSTEPQHRIPTVQTQWITFIKQKIKEGNFCPVDAHTISTMERLKYERLTKPRVIYESEGQFDDCSSDS